MCSSALDPVVELVVQLVGVDPLGCDRDGLTACVAMSQRLRGWLDSFDARVAVRAAALAEQGRCEAPSGVLAGGGRRGVKDVRAVVERGRVCDLLPGVHDALAAGDMSAGHVDALARVAKELDDAGRSELRALESSLVDTAKETSVERFERRVRDLGRLLDGDDGLGRDERLRRQRSLRRWVDRHTGMCHTHLQLDPEADAKVAAVLDAAIATERDRPDPANRRFDQLQADVLVDLVTGARATDRRVPEICVLVDYDTLCVGSQDHSICETNDGNGLAADTVRRLCCEATILPVVLNGAGVALDVGRDQRLATRAQRRALRAMYRSCGHPGCAVRFDACRIHHVRWWDLNGSTDLHNLIPLCSVHHHLVHEGGSTLTLDPDRTITLTRPDGTISFTGNTIDVAPTGTATRLGQLIQLAHTRIHNLSPPTPTPAA